MLQKRETLPENANYTEISACSFLKCEETCYGTICYCDFSAWGKKPPCKDEVKKVCESEHYLMV
ncbi:hypothetical protein SAMN05660826_00621 [Caldanaerovirga acetigignens]|uniref:Uncharacterized protein n=1 Tax=Caldanaerovirga acetigignens TaxID=447595 RepID=A0A1M7HER0_9FIRM|nr:hypothetical protein [Caldanaerovirga acetigignens]SHM27021.1 hypothetical protein SAMN05660826_00621 [Caldanaerovirga acetigignens]